MMIEGDDALHFLAPMSIPWRPHVSPSQARMAERGASVLEAKVGRMICPEHHGRWAHILPSVHQVELPLLLDLGLHV